MTSEEEPMPYTQYKEVRLPIIDLVVAKVERQ